MFTATVQLRQLCYKLSYPSSNQYIFISRPSITKQNLLLPDIQKLNSSSKLHLETPSVQSFSARAQISSLPLHTTILLSITSPHPSQPGQHSLPSIYNPHHRPFHPLPTLREPSSTTPILFPATYLQTPIPTSDPPANIVANAMHPCVAHHPLGWFEKCLQATR